MKHIQEFVLFLGNCYLVLAVGFSNLELFTGENDWSLVSWYLMLKLKLQYFGHLVRRADSFEKTMMLGMIDPGQHSDPRLPSGGGANLERHPVLILGDTSLHEQTCPPPVHPEAP